MWLIIYICCYLYRLLKEDMKSSTLVIRQRIFKWLGCSNMLVHLKVVHHLSFFSFENFSFYLFIIFIWIYFCKGREGKGRQVNVAFRIRDSWGMRRGDKKDSICYHWSLDLFQFFDAHFGAHIIKKNFHLHLNLLYHFSPSTAAINLLKLINLSIL